jgi:ribosomal protein S18 acetylase RimI-like enzyme
VRRRRSHQPLGESGDTVGQTVRRGPAGRGVLESARLRRVARLCRQSFAYIRDLTVDVPYRRAGVGSRLMEQAARWAHQRGLAGVMAETQNVNVPACRFYDSFGFLLGGFDMQLYRGFPELAGEMALFCYLVF